MFDRSILDAARTHARSEYPKESCGLVVDGVYIACRNVAEDPEKDFAIHPKDQASALKKKKLQAVIHSHPDGPLFPTQADMEGQIATNVPWGIVPLDDERISDPFFWGDGYPVAPILGREFRHGIHDCYAVIRDIYALGKDGCAEQGIDWPFDPIKLIEIPRNDGWWETKDDHYLANFERAGFVKISGAEVRPGDVFLMKLLQSPKLNHGAVILSNGLMLHHLPARLSRREPSGMWARAADLWLRYEGSNAA